MCDYSVLCIRVSVRRWADRRKNANFCFQAGSPNQIRVCTNEHEYMVLWYDCWWYQVLLFIQLFYCVDQGPPDPNPTPTPTPNNGQHRGGGGILVPAALITTNHLPLTKGDYLGLFWTLIDLHDICHMAAHSNSLLMQRRGVYPNLRSHLADSYFTYFLLTVIKETEARDFRPSVFFIKQSPLGPWLMA
jgi:hypothetical protein